MNADVPIGGGARESALGKLLSPLGLRSRGISPTMPGARGPAACLQRETRLRRALLLSDTLSVAGALALTRLLDPGPAVSWRLALLALPVLSVSGKLAGLYDRDPALLRKSTLDELPRIVQLVTISVFATWLATGALPIPRLQPSEAAILWISLVALVVSTRACCRCALTAITSGERCMVIGDELAAKSLRGRLEGGRGVNAQLVAHVDLDRVEPWSSQSFSASRLQEIGHLAQSLDVHRAIIAPRSLDAGETLDLVRTLNTVGVRVSVLPRVLEAVGSSVEFDDVHGLTLMGVSRFELTRSSLAIKRLFDVCCAALGLLVLSPVLIAIAAAIAIDSRGGILFRQQRAGRRGRPFSIYKFRTMIADADAHKDALRAENESEGLFKIRSDPRITRVGALLRRTALDELPQLINVLRGEMSLVGPRPLVLDEDRQVQGWYRRRLELTPGLTGPWQILGPTRSPLGEMVAIDYLYVANWSLWSDVKILIRTFSYVLLRRGC